MFYNSRHGGNIYLAEQISGISAENIVDLSTNINPLGIPQEVVKYLKTNVYDVLRYPDLEYRDLYKSLENLSGLSEENIIAGNGASEIINLFVSTIKPKKVLIVHPTYGEYERECHKYNLNIDYYVPEGAVLDMEELKKRIPKYNAVFICNPNNPTGLLLPKISLLELLPLTHKTWLFIDESFMDFVVDSSRYSLKTFVDKAKIFILHSLTKIFSIPGLRIGCGYGPVDLVTAMKEMQIPWSINSMAANCAPLAIKDSEFLEQTRSQLEEYRNYSLDLLADIRHIGILPSATNFLLLNISQTGFTSSLIQQELLRKGFLIRNGNTFPGLKEDFIRIAIKDKPTMQEFVSVFKKLLNEGDTL